MDDFLDHYTIIPSDDGNHLVQFDEAKRICNGDMARMWFVRTNDGDETDEDDDPVWTVEPWHGQFVNFAGFFVSVEPCRLEHRDKYFTY